MMRLSNSYLKPFITDITIIKVATPMQMPINENQEINSMLQDIELTLQSLNYSNKEIKKLFPILVNEIKNKSIHEKDKISFEFILKLAMNHLDNNSNLGR